jgi:hypothetical protein
VHQAEVAGGRVRVARDGILAHRRQEGRGRGHLDADFFRPGQEHLVLDDLDVLEAVLDPAIARPLGELAVARRAGEVRLRGEQAVAVADAVGVGEGEQAPLEAVLGRAVSREAESGRVDRTAGQ